MILATVVPVVGMDLAGAKAAESRASAQREPMRGLEFDPTMQLRKQGR